jgi:hypothetical protein
MAANIEIASHLKGEALFKKKIKTCTAPRKYRDKVKAMDLSAGLASLRKSPQPWPYHRADLQRRPANKDVLSCSNTSGSKHQSGLCREHPIPNVGFPASVSFYSLQRHESAKQSGQNLV